MPWFWCTWKKFMDATIVKEKIRGVVERVTYHNESNGWSVLRVSPFNSHGQVETVTVHQTKVFAGATMQFTGTWTHHPRFGRQFRADNATEIKPASASALEKYIGSGLIKGVGPKTARKIVRYFDKDTLEVFDNNIEKLLEVPGIAAKKLKVIKSAWLEHKGIRDVMMFLQSHGISTLFAVRIFKQYGDRAIGMVRENPYRLAIDFYGIGFFTADRVALSLGLSEDSNLRIQAAIRHLLSASREQGHCYLTVEQIVAQANALLGLSLIELVPVHLEEMKLQGQLKERRLNSPEGPGTISCYYSNSLYHDEKYVADRLSSGVGSLGVVGKKVDMWRHHYAGRSGITLSPEQVDAVVRIVDQKCSVLTGGPGCGKTTATRAIVDLLIALDKKVLLAAPTGRAAQRMGEVIGVPAKTIHRLLEFQGTGFKRNLDNPLKTDFLIVDESSMLDIPLTASLLRAVAPDTALLFIGDADQLPSVGPGNVLADLIASGVIPCFRLTTIFRQARESLIIATAHQVNRGVLPPLNSPFKTPGIWKESDCFFIDADQATQRQLQFISRVKRRYSQIEERESLVEGSPLLFGTEDTEGPASGSSRFSVPEPFEHVSLEALAKAKTDAEQMIALAKKTHPWSSLYYGLTALDVVRQLYTHWVKKYYGKDVEIQVLAPMIRGPLGTANLNLMLQENVNPPGDDKPQLQLGERIFRIGDRVIHRRNNYDLNVFNGDIGIISAIDTRDITCVVKFPSDQREVVYTREQVPELDLAYAITVHKAQGSEFDVVILPVLVQHFKMLFRNLLYTGLTRGRKLVVFVGTRKAMAIAVGNKDTTERQTALRQLLVGI